MFDKILNMIGSSNPSYKGRLQSMDEFFTKYDLYKEMWPKQPDQPLSIVWAVSTSYPEIFMQQIGSMAQMTGIFHPDDEIVFVIDSDLQDIVGAAKSLMSPLVSSKLVVIERPFPGDGPTLSWDVGVPFTRSDNLFFIRDLCLFFNPWEMLLEAREFVANDNLFTYHTLANFSTVLGPVWSRFTDRWMYLVHPEYAPTPFLFAFVADKRDYNKVNGFDTRFGRGYDHTGELDFLLRWNMAGFIYGFTRETHLFHPGITANSQEELQDMQFQSSINRRYFFDRYGEDMINNLKPPYSTTTSLIDVNHALTLAPLSQCAVEDRPRFKPITDAFTFSKLPHETLIREVI